MTNRLTVSREAEYEATDAAQWYELRSKGLGVGFAEAVDVTLARVEDSPLQFPVVYRDVRRALLRRFPYGVFFRLRGSQVRVIAIMHLRRDPRRWQRR